MVGAGSQADPGDRQGQSRIGFDDERGGKGRHVRALFPQALQRYADGLPRSASQPFELVADFDGAAAAVPTPGGQSYATVSRKPLDSSVQEEEYVAVGLAIEVKRLAGGGEFQPAGACPANAARVFLGLVING